MGSAQRKTKRVYGICNKHQALSTQHAHNTCLLKSGETCGCFNQGTRFLGCFKGKPKENHLLLEVMRNPPTCVLRKSLMCSKGSLNLYGFHYFQRPPCRVQGQTNQLRMAPVWLLALLSNFPNPVSKEPPSHLDLAPKLGPW